MVEVLPDVLQQGLKVVFCGTAASTKSAQVGAYYAGPGNRFWPTLYEIGLTPEYLQPTQFRSITEFGIGLTDVAKHASGMDSALSQSDFDGDILQEKIIRYRPKIVAFTSKRAVREGVQLKPSASIDYGMQLNTIGDTRVFVLPSPSGAARGYWNVDYWFQLAAMVQQIDIN